MKKLCFYFGAAMLWMGGLASANASASASVQGLESVKKILQKYAQAGSVSMQFEKKMHFELLDKSEKHTGSLVLSQGRVRIESLKPHKMLTVLDDKALWFEKQSPLVAMPQAGLLAKAGLSSASKSGARSVGTGVQVIKLPFDKSFQHAGRIKSAKGSPLQQFLQNKSLWNKIKLKPWSGATKLGKGEREYVVDLSQVPQLGSWAQVRVRVQAAKRHILGFFLKNKLGNTTEYTFQRIRFSSRKRSLTYTPPKGAEIIEN